MKSARPRWIIGRTPGLTLARAQSWPGTRISVTEPGAAQRRLLDVSDSLYAMVDRHRDPAAGDAVDEHGTVLPEPALDADAAVLFTSGSTGPAKGVVYTHERLGRLVALISRTLGIRPGGSLLAGFAPFALLGPALGAASVSPGHGRHPAGHPHRAEAGRRRDRRAVERAVRLPPPPWRTWSRPPTASTHPRARPSTPCASCSRPAPPCTRS
ncbi:hypothetical protein GY12_16575 [Micrococcus luteus]|nr:hypothetical protein GY12_16575 [Micrococcus luteus]